MYAGPHSFTTNSCLLYMGAHHKPAIYLRVNAVVYICSGSVSSSCTKSLQTKQKVQKDVGKEEERST